MFIAFPVYLHIYFCFEWDLFKDILFSLYERGGTKLSAQIDILFLNSLHHEIFNDILHMSCLAGTHVFKAYPAYITTEI